MVVTRKSFDKGVYFTRLSYSEINGKKDNIVKNADWVAYALL